MKSLYQFLTERNYRIIDRSETEGGEPRSVLLLVSSGEGLGGQ